MKRLVHGSVQAASCMSLIEKPAQPDQPLHFCTLKLCVCVLQADSKQQNIQDSVGPTQKAHVLEALESHMKAVTVGHACLKTNISSLQYQLVPSVCSACCHAIYMHALSAYAQARAVITLVSWLCIIILFKLPMQLSVMSCHDFVHYLIVSVCVLRGRAGPI